MKKPRSANLFVKVICSLSFEGEEILLCSNLDLSKTQARRLFLIVLSLGSSEPYYPLHKKKETGVKSVSLFQGSSIHHFLLRHVVPALHKHPPALAGLAHTGMAVSDTA